MKKQRNRRAAKKCRDKKQMELAELEQMVADLKRKRTDLEESNQHLTKELRILQFQSINLPVTGNETGYEPHSLNNQSTQAGLNWINPIDLDKHSICWE